METLTVMSIAQFVGAVGTAIVLLWGAGHKIVAALDKRMDAKLAPISKQLHPNGGDSLPDRMTRLELAFKETSTTEARHHQENVGELEYLRQSHNVIRRALVNASGSPAIDQRAMDELDRIDDEFERRRATRRTFGW